MHSIVLIVFLPLLAAIVAGLFGRWIGKTAAKVVTTGSLFVGAFLSWPIFLQYVAGDAAPGVVPVLDWIHSGTLTVAAAEAAIGLAILVVFFRRRGSIAVDDVSRMHG
jgi:NADH-quinone oxidoreductase subunit L